MHAALHTLILMHTGRELESLHSATPPCPSSALPIMQSCSSAWTTAEPPEDQCTSSMQVKGKQFPVEVFSAFPARPGMNGAEGPQPEVRDEQGRRLGRGEREAIIAAENPNGDEASPTAAATRRIGVLVTKRPMIGRDRALTQVWCWPLTSQLSICASGVQGFMEALLPAACMLASQSR